MERFWNKVEYSQGCWNWKGTKNEKGYGYFYHHGKMKRAHRFSYENNFGEITKGLHILHRCDNPSCVRPEHLFEGTQKENMEDCCKKSRFVGGAKARRKINEKQALLIKKMISSGNIDSVISEKLGVSKPTIRSIRRGSSWKQL